MRFLVLFFALCAAVVAIAATPLRSEYLRGLVAKSVDAYLLKTVKTSDDVSLGVVDESQTQMLIEDAVERDGVVVEMKVTAAGSVFTYDHEFGDPVSEVEFRCTTWLKRKVDGEWRTRTLRCGL